MNVLSTDIRDKNFKRAYLLCGEEEYLKLKWKQNLIRAVVSHNTMNVSVFEGKNINIHEIIDSAKTAPFFAEYKLIVIEDSGLFKRGGDLLADYMQQIPESTIFLFVEKDVDKRSKMYKAVKLIGHICETVKLTENNLALWIAKLFAEAGKNITKSSVSYMIANIGTDMETLSQEVAKLISYTYERDVVTKEDIEAVCTKQLSVRIFDMMDAISVKNQTKTLRSYYELTEHKEPPMRILYMLSRQFHLILQAKDLSARGMSKSQIAQTMGVRDFIAGKCISQCKNFSVQELQSALEQSVKTEEMIKSGKMDEHIGVEMLLVQYSRKQ